MPKSPKESLAERAERLLGPERALWRQRADVVVAGVDEVGLGPLAGPVVAAAVVLPRDIGGKLVYLNDSKQVTAKRRQALVPLIAQHAVAWAIAEASVAEIDALNVFQAARLAAGRAVLACQRQLATRRKAALTHLLLDAHPLPHIALPQICLVKGDAASQSIAAASVLAKEARDGLMAELAAEHAGYGFAQHAGYPTPAHLAALAKLGACAAHRRTFGPVARLLARNGQAPTPRSPARQASVDQTEAFEGAKRPGPKRLDGDHEARPLA